VKFSLQFRSFLALAGLLIALLLAINLALGLLLPRHLRQRIKTDLQRSAHLAAAVLDAVPRDQLNTAAHRLHDKTGLRFTVITSNGVVIAESNKTPEELASIENHLYRPEIQDALRHGTGSAIRHSDTVNVDLLYVAVTVSPEKPVMIYRVALPLVDIAATVSHVRSTILIASLIVGLLAIPIG